MATSKTTLYLTDEQARALRRLSDKIGRPQAELIREAVDEYVLAREPKRKLPSFVGALKEGIEPDLSSRVEETLHGYFKKRFGRRRSERKR